MIPICVDVGSPSATAPSYEARAFGVRSAMSSTTAMRKCADLVFVPPRFDVCRAVSQQIRTIFADYTSLIEPVSLDEAYLDVTENRRGISTATATAAEMRARILDETGLTASAGICPTKCRFRLARTGYPPHFWVRSAKSAPRRGDRHDAEPSVSWRREAVFSPREIRTGRTSDQGPFA